VFDPVAFLYEIQTQISHKSSTEIDGPLVWILDLQTAREPIRMQEATQPYNNTSYFLSPPEARDGTAGELSHRMVSLAPPATLIVKCVDVSL